MTRLTLCRERKQAQYFTEKLGSELGLDMILISAGRFLMGSPENEPERLDAEGPQHEVTLPSFFMGRYPVTQAQWRFVAGLPQVKQELNPDPAHFKGENRPIENVTWYDAVEFCARLAAYTHRPYRLPSEAEWEYACRASPIQTSGTPGSGEVRSAGTTTPFSFGEILTTEVANYNGNYTYNGSPKGEYREETTPVDHFGIANDWGLCDMHGNVFEWCQDQWHENYENAPTDGSAWVDREETGNVVRVIRGGSWSDNPRVCRSAYRDLYFPRGGINDIGFRVVCSTPRTLP